MREVLLRESYHEDYDYGVSRQNTNVLFGWDVSLTFGTLETQA